MTERYLIVGLGNPGREYEQTRHNIGFRCLDALASSYSLAFVGKKARAVLAEGVIKDRRVMLAKPQTYMNLSGESVRVLVDFYKIPVSNLIVISDDMDIPLGMLRIRQKGSAGGQKGLNSIINHLGTQDFARLRFGIGRPPGRMEPAAYVLQPFAREDTQLLNETIDRAVKAIELWLTDGIEIAMMRQNGTADDAARNATAGIKKPPSPPPAPPVSGQTTPSGANE